MEDNQINGQKINKETYCPNSFFDNGTISIGKFKTLDDAMNFPIKEIWCINRTEDNKFQSYKSQGSRLFIICSWNRSTQDPLKFVLALIHKDKVGKLYYWDMNDLPLYPDEKKNQYEGSLGDDATYTLYQIANNKELNCNTYMNKKLRRLTELDLHKIIKKSVENILEGSKKKDPMQQWFKDFDNASKYRETMDYVSKGGRKPKHLNKIEPTNEATNSSAKPNSELEDALQNVLGVLHKYVEEDFVGIDKNTFDRLYETISDVMGKISDTYDFGPYEGEPIILGIRQSN